MTAYKYDIQAKDSNNTETQRQQYLVQINFRGLLE